MLERVAAGLVTLGFVAAGAGLVFGWLSGPVAVGVAAGITGALYTALLVSRALAIHIAAGSYAPCRGVGFLGMGVLAGGVSLVSAMTDPVRGPGLVGIGVAASSVLFLLGLLLLPGTAPTLTSRMRRMLDGVAIGLSLFFAGWTLVVVPLTDSQALPVSRDATAALVLVMALSAALAVTGLIGARAVQHRTSAQFCCAGVAVCLLSQAAAALSLLVGAGWGTVLAVLAIWALGPVLIWAGARRSAEGVSPIRRREPMSLFRLATTTTPLLAGSAGLGVLGAVYHLSVFGDWGVYTAVLAVSAASAVGIRGMFASLDVCRYTNRLVHQETKFLSTDPLTAIPNRMRLRHRLEAVRGRAEVGHRFGTLLVIDLDNFGELDDVMGHDVGDAVLMEVARRLRTSVEPGDLAVRLAGDAFAVFTVASREQAARLAERLGTEVALPYRVSASGPGAMHLTASIGVAECNAASAVDEVIRAAELAVSNAQELGGNRIEWYDDLLELRTLRRRTFAHELLGAVRRDELDLRYVPVVTLPDGVAVELQARTQWRHATLGEVSTAELVAAAQDTGLTSEIRDGALRGAIRQFGQWIAEGRDLSLSVRISAAQLRTPGFAARVGDLLRAYDVPPDRLVLEVMEDDLPATGAPAAPLAALREVGVRTGLAGFGAGRSSLLELRRLPIDRLTIDKSLIAALRESEPVVATVVDLAHRLSLEVVAGGVAETWQAELLRGQGCRYAMGPLFSRPVPAEYAEAYLDAHAGGTDSANLRP